MSHPTIIDTHMHGRPGSTAAFVVRGAERVALVETGPKSVVHHVFEGLDDAGIDTVDVIAVTHIHLDHAGAAGTIAERFPEARVVVHEVGAPHLADPTTLWSSAGRIYGDRMDELWGGIDPIPEARIDVIADGETIDLGGVTLRAIETPGHAHHHHAYLCEEEGYVITGDALGIRLPDVGFVRPATPPPEFHMEKAIASIERVASLGADTLIPTHFGPHDQGKNVKDVSGICEDAIGALRTWGEWVLDARAQTKDLDAAAEMVKQRAVAAMEGALSPDAVERMENTTSYWMNTWGYMRYFDKNQA